MNLEDGSDIIGSKKSLNKARGHPNSPTNIKSFERDPSSLRRHHGLKYCEDLSNLVCHRMSVHW